MDSDPWDVEIPSSSPEFDGHNYWRWSRGVRCALMRAGVWKCVVSGGASGKPPFKATSADLYTPTEEEYEEWLLRDDTALAVIRRSLGRGCQHLAYEESSAAVLWQRIKRNYGTHSLADMFGLWEKIAKYRFSEDSNKTVEDQAYELLDLCDELADGGVEISEIQRVFAILSALPDSYHHLFYRIITFDKNTISTLTATDVITSIKSMEGLFRRRRCEKCGKDNHTTENHRSKRRRKGRNGYGRDQ